MQKSVIAVVILLVVACGAASWYFWANRGPEPAGVEVAVGPALKPAEEPALPLPEVKFTDVTTAAGIRFAHDNGAFGKRLLPETMGAGAAFLDYDNDGDQDLLLINSCAWPGHEKKDRAAPTMAFYQNRGNGTFEDVTAAAGLAVTMYGMGAAVGDVDNDGWVDLFITGVGGNRLFLNSSSPEGRRFVERTESAGAGGPGGWPKVSAGDFLEIKTPINFSSSAAFFDYDGDGRLDLFVCNYIRWSPHADLSQAFQLVGIGRSYGPPNAFDGVQCLLYHNQGQGRLTDVSETAGIHVYESLNRPVGKSLGVAICDVDDDGFPDVVVANDTVRNFLFHNQQGKRFDEIGLPTGVAYAEGQARGAMGIDWAEYAPDRRALVIGNFADEPNTFLRLDNRDPLLFSDTATVEGIAGPSRRLLKFGAFFFDYDLDGWQDVLTCNGHLEPEIHQVQASQQYRQPAQLFHNCQGEGVRGFAAVPPAHAGSDLFEPIVGRGSAFADIDGDGDLDLILTQNNGPAKLLRNDGGNRNHWVRFLLEGDGKRSNRSAIGAKIIVVAGGRTLYREVANTRGYLSQSELPVTIGLGPAAAIERATIRWPGVNGGEQVLTDLAVDRVHRITQGQ